MSLPAMSPAAASAGWTVPRRWVVAAAATFGMLASFGMATTVSVFIKPFEDEFGWLRADISFAYALFSAGAALGGLVVGWRSTASTPASSWCSAPS